MNDRQLMMMTLVIVIQYDSIVIDDDDDNYFMEKVFSKKSDPRGKASQVTQVWFR